MLNKLVMPMVVFCCALILALATPAFAQTCPTCPAVCTLVNPPTCTGANFLQFNGTTWDCATGTVSNQAICGVAGMIYGPAHPLADVNGCIANFIVGGTGGVTVGSAMSVSSQGDVSLRRFFNGDLVWKRALVTSGSELSVGYADYTSVLLAPISGNVGVGVAAAPISKLTVNGDVKIGNSAAVCDAAHGGALRYDTVSKSMEYCNETAWMAMAAGGAGGGGAQAFAVHSLSNVVPTLPAAQFELLWAGYSYAGAVSGASSTEAPVDLKSPESCSPAFKPLPIMQCGGAGVWPQESCVVGNSGISYWLTIGMTAPEGVITGVASLIPKISRCAVFQPKAPVVIKYDFTVASPSNVTPPVGWSTVYNGYTLLGTFGSQGYVSTSGSACVQNFATLPIIECGHPLNGGVDGCQFFTGGDNSSWATTQTVYDIALVSPTAANLPRVGRCAMFIKN